MKQCTAWFLMALGASVLSGCGGSGGSGGGGTPAPAPPALFQVTSVELSGETDVAADVSTDEVVDSDPSPRDFELELGPLPNAGLYAIVTARDLASGSSSSLLIGVEVHDGGTP